MKKILNKNKIDISNKTEEFLYSYYMKAELYNKGYRQSIDENRIIDNYFFVTTQHSIGYVNRDDNSFDKMRDFIVVGGKKNKDYGLLYIEELKDGFLYEKSIAHFNNLKSAINWVGRYGCADSDKAQYYYISKRFVYRIWNSTHLNRVGCDRILGKDFLGE